MSDLYIARQPIYDQYLGIMGYELLYRGSNQNSAQFVDASNASSEAIVNSFIHIGIDNLVGTALAFVNLPSEFIINDAMVPMFHQQSVLELECDFELTEELLLGIIHLKDKGYKISLNNFKYTEMMDPVLRLADFVKVNTLEYKVDALKGYVDFIKSRYACKLIAEKIETKEALDECKELGFNYFQGYFFCYPQIVSQKDIPINKMVILNLINQIQDPEMDFQDLENTLTQDVTLTYKLLRYINSAAFPMRREIDTIKDAIVILGLDTVKNWASLILMNKIIDEKPKHLITTALVRAKMAEIITETLEPSIHRQSFICGLFSVIDALMDKPMIMLLDTVILSTQIKMALLEYEGELGSVLRNCLLYERAKFNELVELDIDFELYNDSYLSAIKWADSTMQEIQD